MQKLTALLAALACASLLSAAAIDVVETENAGEQTNAQTEIALSYSEEPNITVLTGKGTAVPNMPAKAYDNTGAAGSVKLTADKAVTWSYTFNGPAKENFDIVKTETEITFTSKKNIPAGEIYVTASDKSDASASKTVTVYVYGDNKWTRGEDLITGTKKALDFDNFTLEDGGNGGVIFSKNAELVENPYPDAVNGNGKVMKFTADLGAFFTTYHGGLDVPANRALSISYKYYIKRPNKAGSKAFFLLLNTGDLTGASLNNSRFTETSDITGDVDGKWISDSVTVVPASDETSSWWKQNFSAAGVSKVGLDSKWWVNTQKSEIYVDDFSAVPMWKVTYMDSDNEAELESKWICRDENGNVLSSFNPVSEQPETLPVSQNGYFAGWSVNADSDTADTDIVLANEDIKLYPVFKEMFRVSAVTAKGSEIFAIPAKKYDNTGNVGSITLTADENVDWSYTFSKYLSESNFNITKTDTTIKFEAVGGSIPAGEITVTATAKANSEFKNVKTVYVYGDNKFRPGLDVTTATVKPLDFENAELADIGNGSVLYTYNMQLADNPAADDVNPSAKVMQFTSDGAGFFTTYHYGNLFAARPIYVSYKFYIDRPNTAGSKAFFFTVNNSEATYSNMLASSFKEVGSLNADSDRKWIKDGFTVNAAQGTDVTYWKGGNFLSDTALTKFGMNAKWWPGTQKSSIYIDDFSVIPYYAAKYHADTTLTVYFLLDDGGNILTEYTPALPADAALTIPDGKVLAGWTTVNGGTEPMETITLDNADIDLYPVFADKDFAPHWYNDAKDAKEVTEIRVQKDSVTDKIIDDKSGLRFKGYIEDVYRNDKKLAEYGFIVARTDILGSEQLTHGFKTDAAKTPYISQANYSKADNVDYKLSYVPDLEATIFSCVLVNIPVEHYSDSFTVRTWSLVDGEYHYGTSMSVSILEILNSLEGDRKTAARPLIDKYNEWYSSHNAD